MKREFTNKINWILDNLIPPIIRDNRFFMSMFFFPLFGSKAKYFFDFKENIVTMDYKELESYYKLLSNSHIKRDTDLNTVSIKYILENIEGCKVLDIACGTGYLANLIQERKELDVTAADFNISDDVYNDSGKIIYLKQNIEQMDFEDKYFDTVICTHTLEHTINIDKAINELRRVCKRKLIIVVPRQREYKYTFDLHIHFFPYKWKLERIMNNSNGEAIYVNNDIFYTENRN